MHHGALSLVLAAGIGLAIVTTGAPALAQPSPGTRAAAAMLFEDGKRLMSEGKFAEACPKLEESQRIDPGMGTLFNLATCYEQTNRTASAWVGFRDVAGMALGAGLSDRERVARGRAAALEPKLMRLKITMDPALSGSGVEVKRDGAVVSPTLWGTPVPLDPGKHQVSAVAPGKEPWEVTVVLDQPGGVISVDVPPLLDRKPGAPSAPAPIAVVPVAGGGVAPLPSPPPEGAPRRTWQRPLGITFTVVGVAGLGTSLALGLLGKSAFDSANKSNCDVKTGYCNPTGLTQRADAVKKGNIGTGVFVAGAVLAAGGVVLWVTAPSSKRATSAWQAPQIGLSPSGAAVRGGF